MRESEKRISEYQKVLPHLKEKVSTVAFLFVLSIVMMTAATFAWLVISKSPSVEGITTSVTANGNLEIALSDFDGLEPDESAVGDSGKDIIAKNITWGNLVNLSHNDYGLQDVVLRPASLNDTAQDFLDRPLKAVVYGSDGRASKISADFAYLNYKEGKFQKLANPYGVRAVSSVTYEYAEGEKLYREGLAEIDNYLGQTQTAYYGIVNNQDKMAVLGTIIGKFLTEKVDSVLGDGTNVQNYAGDIDEIVAIMKELDEQVMRLTGETYLRIANTQLLLTKSQAEYESLKYDTVEELVADTKLSAKGIVLEGFSQYKSDRTNLKKHISTLESILDEVNTTGRTVSYSNISTPVNFLVAIGSTEVDGLPISDLEEDPFGALGMLGTTDAEVVVTEGAIKRIEQRIATAMGVPMTVNFIALGKESTVGGVVSTNADPTKYEIPIARTTTEGMYTGDFEGTDPVAEDVYGMAIDLWVRTNRDNTFLILEGKTLTEKIQKSDSDGSLYYYQNEGTDDEVIIVKYGDNYYTEGDRVNALTDIDESTLTPIMVDKVIGFEGENRIWADNTSSQNDNSATQGMGSCYVFYADTPEIQDKSLVLLKSMKVAFIDSNGKILARAKMDTDMYFAENGRVTVPLVLDKTKEGLDAGTDDRGNELYGITQLKSGKAVRITALVYLDGGELTNDQVMAAADMQGQLNIQFGSSENLEPIDNETLRNAKVKLTASADTTKFEEYSRGDTASTKITLNIEGDLAPANVTGNFVRKINASQGTRQPSFMFKMVEEGKWEGDVTFTAPGTYVLRTVWLDGIEYELENEITIEWPGFSVKNVTWDLPFSYEKEMTGDSSYKTNIYIETAGTEPNSVQCVLSNEYGQLITVDMNKRTNDWSGTANFVTSGTYKLQYAIIDGEYYEIPTESQKTLELFLGMTVKCYIPSSQTEFKFDYANTENNKVDIRVEVYDDKGNTLNSSILGNTLDVYYRASSILGVDDSLLWNATEEKYIGAFDIPEPGIYSFSEIIIGDDSISQGESPVIYAVSPEPPSYSSASFNEYALYVGSPITIDISLQNAGGLSNVNAVFVNKSADTEIIVPASGTPISNGLEYTYTYNVPTNPEGIWSVKELRIVGAYVDGEKSTEDKPYIIDLTNKNIFTEIESLKVSVNNSYDKTFNQEFMVKPLTTADDISIIVCDGANGELKYAPNEIEVTYALDNVSNATGYTSAFSGEIVGQTQTITLSRLNNGTEYKVTNGTLLDLTYAGIYVNKEVSFDIVIGENTYTYTTVPNSSSENQLSMIGTMPKYTVNWVTPEVKFTATDPIKGSNFTARNNSKNYTVKNTYTDYNVEVYFKAEEGALSSFIWRYYDYTASKAETTLSKAGNITSASCTIIDAVNNGLYNVEYKYTKNDLIDSQNIGKADNITGEDKKYHIAGSKAETVILINDDLQYTFTLKTPLTVDAKSTY